MKVLNNESFNRATVYINSDWDISDSSFDMCTVFIHGRSKIDSCYFECCLIVGLVSGISNTLVNCK